MIHTPIDHMKKALLECCSTSHAICNILEPGRREQKCSYQRLLSSTQLMRIRCRRESDMSLFTLSEYKIQHIHWYNNNYGFGLKKRLNLILENYGFCLLTHQSHDGLAWSNIIVQFTSLSSDYSAKWLQCSHWVSGVSSTISSNAKGLLWQRKGP